MLSAGMRKRILTVISLLGLLWLAGCAGLPPPSALPASYSSYPGAEPGTLRTADGLTLFSQWWKPASAPRAVIILQHGTAAHVGAYTPWAHYLTSQGYAFFAYDMRGWGQSQGFGRRAFVRSHDEYVKDLELAFAEVQKTYPGTPIYLQGESLGAGVVMQASIRGGFPVQGLILNAPPVYVNLKVGPRMPNWMATPMVWTGGLPGRMAPNAPLFPMQREWAESWIWNKAIFSDTARRAVHEDPHFTHSAIAASYVTALGKGSAQVRRDVAAIREPFIVLQGDTDYLVSPASADYLLKNAGSSDKTVKMYEGMSHCTLHDEGRARVWADIVAWLDARVPATFLSADDEHLRVIAGQRLREETIEQSVQRLGPMVSRYTLTAQPADNPL